MLHQGWRFHDTYVDDSVPGVTANRLRIINAYDDNQANVNRPILLDENGFPLPEGSPPVWMEIQTFSHKLPYSALGLF